MPSPHYQEGLVEVFTLPASNGMRSATMQSEHRDGIIWTRRIDPVSDEEQRLITQRWIDAINESEAVKVRTPFTEYELGCGLVVRAYHPTKDTTNA